MVNMDGPMVTATAVPPSKRRRTADRRRVAISDTYRPFAGRRMCSAYSCDQAHQAGDRLDVWARAMPVAAAPWWVTTLATYQTAREGPGVGRRV